MMTTTNAWVWLSIVEVERTIHATGFVTMCILPSFRKMGGRAVTVRSGTLWLLLPMKTVCATAGQLLILFGHAHLSLLFAPKMFWCMNLPMLSVYGVETGRGRDIKDAKWKNTSHATTCSSHYLLMMMD
jgi:hypothetical protein